MSDMREASGLRRLALFLTALEALASSSECHAIASPGYTAGTQPLQPGAHGAGVPIHQRTARPADPHGRSRAPGGLSDGAFSRFFRLHSGRTFPTFVNQLRIGRACRLLAESGNKITDIAFACGFTNLSNFNRQFQRIKAMTPREFGRQVSRIDAGQPG